MCEKRKIPGVHKYLPVCCLMSLLKRLDPDIHVLVPNQVGNLVVSNYQGEYLGFIDFSDSELELFPEESRPEE